MMATPELTASGMMSLARLQMAPLSPTNIDADRLSNNQKSNTHHRFQVTPLYNGSSETLHSSHSDDDVHHRGHNHDREEPTFDYLGMKLTASDLESVRNFEKAWADFVQLKADSGELPKGKREHHIEELQGQIRAIQDKKQSVEGELLKKLAFVRESTDSLEYIYQAKKQKAAQEQQVLYETLTHRIQGVSEANRIREETFPWFHFLRQLDLEARKTDTNPTSDEDDDDDDDDDEEDDDNEIAEGNNKSSMLNAFGQENTSLLKQKHNKQKQNQNHHHHPTAIRPSDRAMCLIERQAIRDEDLADMPLRAYRIDHALLSCHVSMLHKEIERYEKSIQAQEIAGNFLTQHNVWKILSSSSSSSSSKNMLVNNEEEEEEEEEEKEKLDSEYDDDETSTQAHQNTHEKHEYYGEEGEREGRDGNKHLDDSDVSEHQDDDDDERHVTPADHQSKATALNRPLHYPVDETSCNNKRSSSSSSSSSSTRISPLLVPPQQGTLVASSSSNRSSLRMAHDPLPATTPVTRPRQRDP